MFDNVKGKVTGWLIKGMFLLLALSFVLWGVPHQFATFGSNNLATVGETAITPQEYERALHREMDQLRRQYGTVTLEQARMIGVPDRVLDRLVAQEAILNHARALNLALSDAALAEGIRSDPNFQGPAGTFSKEELAALLRQNNISEQAFLALRRQDELRLQLADTLMKSAAVPKPLVDALHAYKNETRIIAYLTVDPDKAVTVPEPDDAKLKAFYDANAAKFMTPEYRKLAILLLEIDQLKDRVPISEEEVKAAYEQTKESFAVPEKRRVQQIAFPDLAKAREAKEAIDKGKGFTEVAAEQGAKLTDIELGLFAKKDMLDPKIADVAFSLERDKVSDPVEGQLATVLLRVTEIQPGKEPSYDEAKDKVRDRLFKERAKAEVQKLREDVEDMRAAGKPLKDIGAKLNIKFVEIDATDEQNLGPDGKVASDLGTKGLIEAGFKTPVGVEGEAKDLPDGGLAWIDAVSSTPPKQKPFDEVKSQVHDLYMQDEKQRALTELGAKLAERLKAGETLEALATEYGGKSGKTDAITRAMTPPELSEAAVKQAFGLPLNGAGFATSSDGKSRTVFRVTEIKEATPADEAEAKKLADDVKKQLEGDVVLAYVDALKALQGVTINQALFRRSSGAETPQ